MANKELVYTVKLKTEGGELVEKQVTTMAELEQSVKDVEEALKTAPMGSKQWQDLNTQLGNSKKAMDNAKQSTMSFGEQLENIPGPIGGVIQGAKGLLTVFKALIANPIGLVITAIVVALTGLYKAFASTKKGAEMIDRVMTGIGAAMDVLRDRVVKVGSAIVKFFSGDFKGAFNEAKGAVSGIGAEISKEFDAAMKAKGKLQQVEDATRKLNVERAKQNLLIADAKLKINDENLSLEDRLKALEEVRKEEIRLAKQEEKLAKERYLALKALADLSDASKETLDELAQAEQEMYNKQLESKTKQKELFDQEKALRDRQRQEAKAAAEERKRQLEEVNKLQQTLSLAAIADEDARAKKQLEINYQANLQAINALHTTEAKKKELRLLAEQGYQLEVDKLNETIKKREEDKAKEEADKLQAKLDKEYAMKVASVNAEVELEQMRLEQKEYFGSEDIVRLKSLLQQQMDLTLQNEELTEAERLLIKEKAAQAMIALDNQVAENKKQKSELMDKEEEQQLQAIGDVFGALSASADEGSEFAKATAAVQAQINAILAASNAFKSAQELPGGIGVVVGPIMAAAALAAGMKQVQAILSTPKPPKPQNPIKAAMGMVGVNGIGTPTGDDVPAMLSSGESVINSAATSRYANILNEINSIGNGSSYNSGIINRLDNLESNMAQNNTPVIKTYVVSSDISNQQQMDNTIKSRSVF